MATLEGHQHRQRWVLFFAIGLFAFAFRFYYVTHAQVLQPVNLANTRGDAVDYYRYARNLVVHRVFSISPEETRPLISDSYRDPGYPLFMAAWMKVCPEWDSWYAAMLLSQALLGALTVVIMLSVGSRWMPLPWLAAAGMLMAIWPHSVVISSILLTETLVGFLCAAGLFCLRLTIDRSNRSWAAASGALLALAALTNAVMLPVAPLLALYLLIRRQLCVSSVACLVAAVLALTIPWAIRNTTLPPSDASSSGRALTNFVQGSWPIFQSVYQAAMQGDPNAKVVMAEVDAEAISIRANPANGLRTIWKRLKSDPSTYIRWYLSKPSLLWSWDIQIGQGDIYVYPTRNSPFETNMFYRIVAAICHSLNPVLFYLMLSACLLAFLPDQRTRPEMAATALMMIFITAVYSTLQAEPRYASPLRGMEIMLAMSATCRGSYSLIRIRNEHRTKPINE